MPLLLVGLVAGAGGFAIGGATSDLVSKLTRLALLAGGGYIAYQVYKGGVK